MKKVTALFAIVVWLLASCSGNEGRQSEHGYGKDTEKSQPLDTFNALSSPDSLKDTINGPRRSEPVK